MNIRSRLGPNQRKRKDEAYAEFAREIAELKKREPPRCPKCLIVREGLPQGFACLLDRCPREFQTIPEPELRSRLQKLETVWAENSIRRRYITERVPAARF
jgi:hypothetical protein